MTPTTTDLPDATGPDTTPDTMEAWEELVGVGLLGTERRPVPATVADTVGTLVGAGPDDGSSALGSGPEVVVLTAAGVLAAYHRAGAVPGSAGSVPVPAPADDDPRPVAPEAALRLLDLVLAGHVSTLGPSGALVELWLERCAASGHRVPPDRAVELLDLASTRVPLRADVATVTGPLGAWLGTHNPAWSWIHSADGDTGAGATAVHDAEDGDQRWATGTRDDRMALLARVRAHDPAAGLTLVERTWKGEKAADRATIVDALAPTVSMADEPFLEAALDDRGKAVRERAASLLATLPDSRLAQRAATRLTPLVSSPKGLLRRKVEVALPTDLDPAALARDGFNERLRPDKVGVRAWELTQLVAIAPLRTWTDLLGLRPAEVVSATSGTDTFDALVRGWTRAVTNQRDAAERTAWVLALLDLPGADPSLFALLPQEVVHAEATKRLKSWPDTHLGSLVGSLPGPWPVDLTRRIVERLAATKAVGQTHGALVTLAGNATTASIPDLEAWAARIGDDDERLRRLVRQAISTISFRQSIHQELP